MRMVIILVVALLVIGGGGAGAYFYMQPKDAEGTETAAKAEEEHGDEHASGTAFVEMDPFMLTVLGKKRSSHNVSLAIVIEVKSDKFIADVEGQMPRLNHYFLEEMYDTMSVELAKGRELSVDDIQGKLLTISKRIVGDDKVEDVLIQLISRHPV